MNLVLSGFKVCKLISLFCALFITISVLQFIQEMASVKETEAPLQTSKNCIGMPLAFKCLQGQNIHYFILALSILTALHVQVVNLQQETAGLNRLSQH